MRFIEWLRIDELTSMSQVDSSGVELESSGQGQYKYKFDDFTVMLYRISGKMVGGKMVDGIWEVSFKRGNSYELTGTSGSGGTAVYGKILGAVKKLTEVEEVNGLKFSGAEARQDIMYDKFLKTLGGFTHVGSDIYIRDEVVKANASGEDLEYYKGVGEKRENGIYNMKVAKAASRNKGLTGKITGYKETNSYKVLPAIIVGFDKHLGLNLISWDGKNASQKYVHSDELEKVVNPSLIEPSLISSLMDETKYDDSRLNHVLKTSGLSVDGSTYDFGFKKEAS